MTCASCDDCPSDAWHLHVTVVPNFGWNMFDTVKALEADITKIGMKPIVITNHFRDGRKPYKELIPTKHVRGTEAEATREIFRMGVLLNNSGWRVKRLKIEGDARMVHGGRALYYETHIKSYHPTYPDLYPKPPISTNAKGDVIYTVRRSTLLDVNLVLDNIQQQTPDQHRRIEAAVLDTAPELDKEWIEQ